MSYMNIHVELEQVSGSVLATKPAPILHSIAGGIALNNFIVVFDPTMFPTTAKLLRQKLEQKFNLPSKFICVSHYHSDHAFGLAAFKDITVISSTNYVENVEKRKETEWRPEDFEEWKKENPTKRW